MCIPKYTKSANNNFITLSHLLSLLLNLFEVFVSITHLPFLVLYGLWSFWCLQSGYKWFSYLLSSLSSNMDHRRQYLDQYQCTTKESYFGLCYGQTEQRSKWKIQVWTRPCWRFEDSQGSKFFWPQRCIYQYHISNLSRILSLEFM